MGDNFGSTLPRRKPSTERPGKPWEVDQPAPEVEVGNEDELIQAEQREVEDLEELAERLEAVKQQLTNAPPEMQEELPAAAGFLRAEVLSLHLEGDRIILAYRSGEGVEEDIRDSCYIDAEGTAEELGGLGLHHLEHRGKVLIYGDEARVLARIFGRELHHPLRRGLIDGKREEAVTVLKEELKGLREAKARVLAIVVPDVSSEERGFLRFHEEMLRGMLKSEGRRILMVSASEGAVRQFPADAQCVGATVHVGIDWTGTGLSFAGMVGKRWGLACGVGDVLAKASGVTSVPGDKLRAILLKGGEDGSEVVGMAARIFLGELFEMVAKRLAEEVKSSWPEGSPGVVRLCGDGARLPGAMELMEKSLEEAGLGETFGKVELMPEPVAAAARGAVLLAEAELKKAVR